VSSRRGVPALPAAGALSPPRAHPRRDDAGEVGHQHGLRELLQRLRCAQVSGVLAGMAIIPAGTV